MVSFSKSATTLLLLFVSASLSGCTLSKQRGVTPLPETSNESSLSITALSGEGWKHYINRQYKYSMDIPEEMLLQDGYCETSQTSESVKFKEVTVDTVIVEKENKTYVVPKYFYKSVDNKCNLEEFTIDSAKELTAQGKGLAITGFVANTPEAILDIISREFEGSCKLEVLKPSKKNQNIFDVVVAANEGGQCNSIKPYIFKYNTATQTGFLIRWAEKFVFYKSDGYNRIPLDETITNSLTFEN